MQPELTSDALNRVSRLAACGQALLEILATVPATPVETGGPAEAAMLQHHLGASGKFREARQICSELKAQGFVVTPGEQIYVDPTVVPALLSTSRSQSTPAAGWEV